MFDDGIRFEEVLTDEHSNKVAEAVQDATANLMIDPVVVQEQCPDLPLRGVFLLLRDMPYVARPGLAGLTHAFCVCFSTNTTPAVATVLDTTLKPLGRLNLPDTAGITDQIYNLETTKQGIVENGVQFLEELEDIRKLDLIKLSLGERPRLQDLLLADLKLRSQIHRGEIWDSIQSTLLERVQLANCNNGFRPTQERMDNGHWALKAGTLFGERAQKLLIEGTYDEIDREVRYTAATGLGKIGQAGAPRLIQLLDSPKEAEINLGIHGLTKLAFTDHIKDLPSPQAERILDRIAELRTVGSPLTGWVGSQQNLTRLIGWIGCRAPEKAVAMIARDLKGFLHDQVDLELNGAYGNSALDLATAMEGVEKHSPGYLSPLEEIVAGLPDGYIKDRMNSAIGSES